MNRTFTRCKSLLFRLTLFTLLFVTSLAGWGQTTLTAGDVAIISVNSDNTDKFTFVLLKNIVTNTVINFTDNGFTGTNTTGRTGEGFLTYTAPGNRSAGTVITWTNGMSISGTGFNSNNPSNFAFNASGDQLFAFQGSTGNWASQSGITLLFGVNYGIALSGTSGASNTLQPSTTILPATAWLNLPSTSANDNYFANGSSSTSSVTVSNCATELLGLFVNSTKWFTSTNEVTFPTYSITVTSPVTPSVSIAANPSGAVCAGTSVTFTATASNIGGGTVTYNFKKGGVSQQNTASSTWDTSSLANGDQITCDISISGGTCLTGTTAGSNTITMSVTANSTPSVSIAANPSGAICPGTSVTFTATASNIGGGTVTYNFKKGGVSQQNTASSTWNTSSLANGDQITCDISISGGTCLTGTTAASNTIAMSVPTVDDGNVCTLDACANGTVTHTFQDTDGDGICNANDNCPNVSGQQGSSCNDNNACTINDVLNASCVCTGTFQDSDGDGTCNANDGCPNDPNKIAPGVCGCGVADADSDGDGILNCNDNCPNLFGQQGDACNDNSACTINDVITAGCICAGTFQDTDGDGFCNANDNCPNLFGQQGDACNDNDACTTNDVIDANCVCAGIFADQDNDGICDANDNCPNVQGVQGGPCYDGDLCTVGDVLNANCQCVGTPDNTDTDGDGILNCSDACPNTPGQPGTPCNDGDACTVGDALNGFCQCVGYPFPNDTDNDGTPDCSDGCPFDANKTAPGVCGCGIADVAVTYYADLDGDGWGDPNNSVPGYTCDPPANYVTNGNDNCPGTNNPAQEDLDNDGSGDACDNCPNDTNVDQADADSDGVGDVCDGCPTDPGKIAPGICGCGVADTDGDADGTADCNDGCPNDPAKTSPGACGCGVVDTDGDGDGTPDCNDGCPLDPNKVSPGTCGCGAPEPGTACDDGNILTVNDQIQLNCSCAGTLVDCDDNDPCTSDTYDGLQCVNTPLPDTDGDGTCDLIDGCPNDTSKIAPGICGCGVADDDFDEDGTADCNDACPDDPEKITPGICGCSTPDDDTDGDGLSDCIDPCPEEMVNLDSDSDGTYDCVDNCPNDPNKVNPGACGCGAADADSDNDTYMDCVDACANDPEKVAPGVCGCGVPEIDTDSDGTFDCLDGCPLDPNKIAPGVCGCGIADTDSDGDGVANCFDNCPNATGQVGSPCDDGDANTMNDVLNGQCQCVGTPNVACIQNEVTLVLNTDANAAQTWYDIVNSGTNTAVCGGGGFASSSTITVACCLPNGCYDLRVFDSFGDGINPGGYVLRDANNKVIIDNANNGQYFTALSQVRDVNNVPLSFCVPLGTDGLTASTCGNETANPGTVLQAVINPSVSAAYMASNSTTGYQWWFFNPNGGYSRRLFQSHASPGTSYPGGTPIAQRCAHLKLSAVITNPLPQNALLNVRVRSQVYGVYAPFGPACRLRLGAPVCQTTQLTTTADPAISCGATVNRSGGMLHANAVTGANKYQFNFTRPGYTRNIAVTTRSLTLAVWVTNPLVCGLTYDVKVRVSLDNGATYCPYGPTCPVTITCSSSFVGDTRELEAESIEEMRPLHVWPNPNDGEQLFLSLEGIDPTVEAAIVDITDLFGRRVFTRTIPVEGRLNQPIELNNTLAKGVYVLTVTTGERVSTERIAIQ